MKKTFWVIDQRLDYTSDPTYSVRDTYDAAVDVAHKFFLSYDFEVRNGKAYDPGHASGPGSEAAAFDCFDNAKMHKGKVAEFMHCGGDGPCCRIEKAK